MIFVLLTGVAALLVLAATVYEGIVCREVPWKFVGSFILLVVLFVSSVQVFL